MELIITSGWQETLQTTAQARNDARPKSYSCGNAKKRKHDKRHSHRSFPFTLGVGSLANRRVDVVLFGSDA
jgi:hypothetical protein